MSVSGYSATAKFCHKSCAKARAVARRSSVKNQTFFLAETVWAAPVWEEQMKIGGRKKFSKCLRPQEVSFLIGLTHLVCALSFPFILY